MELHVEVCHVCPILLCSNLLGVQPRNRLIIPFLTPIQYLQPGQAFSSPLKPFILENAFAGKARARTSFWQLALRKEFPSELETAVSASPDFVETFAAGLPTAAELLELPEHLSRLIGRHIAQSSESLNPRVSVSTHLKSRPQQRPPLANNQTTGVQHRVYATMLTQYEYGSVSCARAVLSGQMAHESWSVQCTYPSIKSHSRSRVFRCEF